MNILILSRNGDILGIAERLVRYGHKVDMFIQNPKMFKAGSGLMNRIVSWRPSLKCSDLVICDGRGFGKFEEILRGNGRPVLGCSRVADYLQESYTRRLSVLRGLHLESPKVFALPESTDKIDWDIPWSLVASNGVASRVLPRPRDFDLPALLRSFPSYYSCHLVEEVQGVPVTVSGWWNGRDWVRPFCYTFMTD